MDKKSLLIFSLLGIVLLSLFSTLPVQDYKYYVTACRLWLHNPEGLYTSENNSFYYMPWTLYLIAPLSLLPDHLGQAVINVCSLAALGISIRILCPASRTSAAGLALLTPYPLSILFLGQWDALVLSAIALSYWAEQKRRPWLLAAMLTLALTKPTNILLVLAYLGYQLRAWPLRLLIKAVSLPLLAVLSSLALCGYSWMYRYLQMLATNPPPGFNIALWQHHFPAFLSTTLTVLLVCSLLYTMKAHRNVASLYVVLLTGNLTLSPFLTPYALVLLTPAITKIAHHSMLYGICLLIASWLTFLVFWFPRDGSWMYLYVVLVYLLLHGLTSNSNETPEP